MTDEERGDYQRLAAFFAHLAMEPSRFAPSGKLAETVKTITKRAKGPAQRPSRKNRRKERQERRMRTAKARRSMRREQAEAYNAAVEQYEQERQEMEEANAELIAKLEAEPKFNVVNAMGQVIMAGVPESMVVKVDDEPAPPKIILPN